MDKCTKPKGQRKRISHPTNKEGIQLKVIIKHICCCHNKQLKDDQSLNNISKINKESSSTNTPHKPNNPAQNAQIVNEKLQVFDSNNTGTEIDWCYLFPNSE